MRLVGLILALGVIVLASFMGDPGLFIDVGSLIIVLGITIGGLLSSGSSIRLLVKALFGINLEQSEIPRAAGACAAARTYAMVSGWIGFVLGLIIVLALIDDIGSIGPGLALSLITVFYALTLSYVILHPLEVRLQNQMGSQES